MSNFDPNSYDYETRSPFQEGGFLIFHRNLIGKSPEIWRKFAEKGVKNRPFSPLGGVAALFFRSGGSGKQIARGFSGRSGRGCGGFWGLVMLGYHPPQKRLYGAFWGFWEGAAKSPRSDRAAVPGVGVAVAVWAGLCGLIWDGAKLGHGRRVPGRSWAAVEGIRKAPERVRLQGWAVIWKFSAVQTELQAGGSEHTEKPFFTPPIKTGRGLSRLP